MTTKLWRTTFLLANLSLFSMTVGCGGGNSGGGAQNNTSPPAVTVSITTPSTATVSVAAGQSMGLAVSVANCSSNCGVTWTVNGVANGNATFGTITAGTSPTYQAPSTVPSPATFNITATSASDTSVSASVGVTITAPQAAVSITSPTNLTQSVVTGATLPITASVAGLSNTALTWTVNSVANGNATFGTISGSGLSVTYQAPASVPSPAAFKVTATSVANTSLSASVNVTITQAVAACGSGNESILSGKYAFSLTGFTSSGFKAVVGSITTDGKGNITGGEADANSSGGSHSTGAVSASTYSVGDDNHGCATITTSFGTFRTRFQLGGLFSGVASAGHIMEFDPPSSTAFIATGQILEQHTTEFSAGLSGGYVHFLEGWDSSSSGRTVCAGVNTSSSGNNTDSEETCNDKGTVTHTGPTTGNVGTYSSVDSNGRLTEKINSTNLVAYFVYSGGIAGLPVALALTTDATPILAGQVIHQSGSFGQSSLQGSYAVYATGTDTASSGKIFFGVYSSTGSGAFSKEAYYENDGGTWQSGSSAPSYTYTVDTYGDTTLSNGSVTDAGHIYLTGSGSSVYVGADSGSFGGYVILQTGSGSFSNSTLDATFFGGTTEIVSQAAPMDGAIVTLDGALGTASITTDNTSTSGQSADQTSSETVSVSSNGTFTTSEDSGQVTGLVIDSDHFLLANHTSSAYPTVMLFGPGIAP